MDAKVEIQLTLSEFLKAKRAATPPEAVGLPSGARPRRVPGLRREELAQLAGVSVDYYIRLEQGRMANASGSVLAALADALRLSDDERAYLFSMGGSPVRGPAGSSPDPSPRRPGTCSTAWSSRPRSCWAGAWTYWPGTTSAQPSSWTSRPSLPSGATLPA
ncbi:helix-turn-helix domain-containing protein [Streptacidiphilus sp. PAMC 29251]